jgi:hypothetical protein
MKKIDKIIRKLDNVLKKVTAQEIIERLEEENNIDTDIEIYHETIVNDTEYNLNNDKYEKNFAIKYNEFKSYNDYEEDELWTSSKAS